MKKYLLALAGLCALAWAQVSSATIGVGCAVFNGNNGTTSATTIASTACSTATSGSTFAVLVMSRNTTAPSSITGTINGTADGNTYTLAQSITAYSGAWLYYCIHCNGGTNHVITATWAATAVLNAISLVEFTGVGLGTFDTAPTGIYNTVASSTGTAPSITTSVANELVIDIFSTYGSNTDTISDTGTGFTIAVSQGTISTVNGAVSWAVPVASSTASADTYSWITADYSNFLSMAIKPAAAPPGNGPLISNGHPVQSGTHLLYE